MEEINKRIRQKNTKIEQLESGLLNRETKWMRDLIKQIKTKKIAEKQKNNSTKEEQQKLEKLLLYQKQTQKQNY